MPTISELRSENEDLINPIGTVNGIRAISHRQMNSLMIDKLEENEDAILDSIIENKEYTDTKFETLSGGVANANPSTLPSSGIDTYNANTAGTYTSFGGIVVTNDDLQQGIVQLRRTGGVWSKVIIPLTGPTVEVVDFTSIVNFDSEAKFSSTAQDGIINFTLDNTGEFTRAFYEVEIETNGDDINFASGFDVVGSIDYTKNVSIIFYRATTNSKVQATILNVAKAPPETQAYRISGFDANAQNARAYLEWVKVEDTDIPDGAFAFNVGAFEYEGVQYYTGNISTNPASPTTSRVAYWAKPVSEITVGGEYTVINESGQTVTFKVGYIMPTSVLDLGSSYPMEALTVVSSPKYRIGGFDSNGTTARSWFEWIRINDGSLPYGAFAFNMGYYLDGSTPLILGNISTNPSDAAGSRVAMFVFPASGIVAGGEYTTTDGTVTIKMGSVIPSTLLGLGNYTYAMQLIIE